MDQDLLEVAVGWGMSNNCTKFTDLVQWRNTVSISHKVLKCCSPADPVGQACSVFCGDGNLGKV